MRKPSRYMSGLDRAEVQKKKKVLATRLLKIGEKHAHAYSSPANDVSHAPAQPEGSENTATGVLDDLKALGFRLQRVETKEQVAVHEGVERLAATFVKAAKSKTAQHVLLWPGSLKSLALAHAVATLSEWHTGNKRGIRTLIYPAKANFLQGLNHITADRKEIASLAASQYEPPDGAPNQLVTTSMREKDPFLTCLNSKHLDEGGGIDPTLSELLPHYFSGDESGVWSASDGALLRRIKGQLGDRSWTRALNELIQAVSDFSSAPDALLALGWRSSGEAVESILQKLKRSGRPEVIVLDLTRGTRKTAAKWRPMTIKFLDTLTSVFGDELPGVLIVSDDPHVRTQLLRELDKRAKNANGLASRLNPILRASPLGIPFTTADEGVTLPGASRFHPPAALDYVVTETDRTAASVVVGLETLKNRAQMEQDRAVLSEAISFLNRLASMPSSVKALTNWLNEADIPLSVREAFSWPSRRVPLTELINSSSYPDAAKLKTLVSKADDMWRAYENGTPFVKQLVRLIEEHTRGEEKCVLVFTRPTARKLAERFFETYIYEGLAPGEGYAILKDRLRLVSSSALNEELKRNSDSTLVFAGLDEEGLRLLISDERIRGRAYVLLTARNAAYLKSSLRAVEAIAGMQSLKPRIDKLLSQLSAYPDIEDAKLSREDFVLPTFSFEAGLSGHINESESDDPDAWKLLLDSGQVLARSPATTIYLYDPIKGQALNRGFRAVQVKNLKPGEQVFVMSGELRELTEAALKSVGVSISHDKRFESLLHQYHTRIAGLVEEKLPGKSQTDKAERLRETIQNMPGCPRDFPTANTIRAWIDARKWLTTAFEENQPHAPRKEAHFKYFAEAVGLTSIEMLLFWKTVIQPMRGTRRADGRRVSDAYTNLLMEQESFAVHQRLDPAVVHRLFMKAQDNVYTVEAIQEPSEVQCG
ncbi:hypothetical protein [Comamonas testosteroni]|uniref:hypothetical protein n=1 Tax=Comamonas testosteroni TaxID=285 RepID=UPI0015FAE5F1|nr:hypothetical protein [Comamonas testosteroni]